MKTSKIVETHNNIKDSCLKCVENGAVLEMVLTAHDIQSMYPVESATLRTWLKQNVFKHNEVRKSGGTHLFTKKGIERVLDEKGLSTKSFFVNGKKVIGRKIIYKIRIPEEKIDQSNKRVHTFTVWSDNPHRVYLLIFFSEFMTFDFYGELQKHLNVLTSNRINTIILTDLENVFEVDEDVLYVTEKTMANMIVESDSFPQAVKDLFLEKSALNDYSKLHLGGK